MMSEELKTIKELADELGVSKKYLQNKISYEKKKQNLSIGNWEKISGKNTIVLSHKEQTLIKSWLDNQEDNADSLGDNQEDNADSLEDKQEDNADSLEDKQEDNADSLVDKQEDNEKNYLKERISVLEKFLGKEQESNSELKKIIQQTQNLLDQQQRLALQDKKLLEEYKSEINELKALKMPSRNAKYEPETNSTEDTQNVTEEQPAPPKKWFEFWR